MTGAEWGVVLGAAVLIGAVLWWFFGAHAGGGTADGRHH